MISSWKEFVMKWNKKITPKVSTKEKFLIFPMCVNGEYRWLEKAKYEIVVYCDYPIVTKWLN